MTSSSIARNDEKHLKESVKPSPSGEVQAYGHVQRTTIALDSQAALTSVDNLNQLLADTITLRDLYKKHHWQAAGPTSYMMHLLFDKHAGEQSELVDLLAERVQTLGGVSLAMAADVAETTMIPRAPKRDAAVDAAKVKVTADGGRVTLSGSVHSWHERREVESAAWGTPGVSDVDNTLTVSY